MPPAIAATLTGRFTLDEARLALRFERELSAAPERVFEAWTDPDQIACWWDPTGRKLAACDVDLRAGGAFSFVMAEHPEMPFAGTYREIAPPGLLTFDALGANGVVRLEQRGTGTHMTVEIVCSSADHLAQFVQQGVAAGTDQTLDNLVAFVG